MEDPKTFASDRSLIDAEIKIFVICVISILFRLIWLTLILRSTKVNIVDADVLRHECFRWSAIIIIKKDV